MARVPGAGVWIAPGVHKKSWTAVTAGDMGESLVAPYLSDKVVHVNGTFGGATVFIEGSNVSATGPFQPIVDPQGVAISFVASGMEQLLENPLYVRPRVSNGDATTSINIRIISRGNLR